jgi:predicted metalloprotease
MHHRKNDWWRAPLAGLAVAVAVVCASCSSSASSIATSGGGQSSTGSSSTVPPASSATATGAASGAVFKNCHLSYINDDGTCSGTAAPGLETLGVYVTGRTIPTFTGTPATSTIDGYLTAVVNDVAAFWTAVYAKYGIQTGSGQPAVSSVHYRWLHGGEVIDTGGCGKTDITSMFYCDLEDTMYVSADAVLADWLGKLLPGETSHPATGEGSAIYTIAHEYGHNVQQEMGINPSTSVPNVEQEADCLSGVYMRGGIDLDTQSNRAEFLNVIANADFSGDYSFNDPQHHGTPDERIVAVLKGHDTANPAVCDQNYELAA